MNSIEERIRTDCRYALLQLRGIDLEHPERAADRIRRALDSLERIEDVLDEAMPEDAVIACDAEAADAERYEDYIPAEHGGES